MTNHDMMYAALKDYKGRSLSTSEIKTIVLRSFPQFSEGSLLPNDHAQGNKNPCSCAKTEQRIFNRIMRGSYRVL